jgi:hypothetical protein
LKQKLDNRPLISREYKVMLVPNEFNNIEKGIDKVLGIIDMRADKYVQWTKDMEEREPRRTWFLDTANFALFKSNKFIVRIREALTTGEIETTVKCRHPDRYISASHDLSSNKRNLQIKFEEDISIPFISQFSLSGTFKNNKMPDLNKFSDLRHSFPRINITGIDETETLRKVKNFEPNEVSYKIGSIKFTEKKGIDLYLNLWYPGLANKNKNSRPLIVELTFNCEAKNPSGKDKGQLEEYSIPLLKGANKLFLLLQSQEMADRTTSKTKTEFAYTYKQA